MLNSDYKDMLLCLEKHAAEYVIVGAYALAAHGIPRATGDIDIFVNPTAENADRVLRALAEFGAPLQGIARDDLKTPGNVLQIGVEPCRIDLLTEIDGVDFLTARHNRILVAVDGINVPVISKDDLITNKLATGRDKDRVDVKMLNEMTGGSP